MVDVGSMVQMICHCRWSILNNSITLTFWFFGYPNNHTNYYYYNVGRFSGSSSSSFTAIRISEGKISIVVDALLCTYSPYYSTVHTLFPTQFTSQLSPLPLPTHAMLFFIFQQILIRGSKMWRKELVERSPNSKYIGGAASLLCFDTRHCAAIETLRW